MGRHHVGYEGHQSAEIRLCNEAFVHPVEVNLRGRLVNVVFRTRWTKHAEQQHWLCALDFGVVVGAKLPSQSQ